MKLRDALRAEARRCISSTIAECDGNVTRSAKLLGVNRTHLYRIAHAVGAKISRQPGAYGAYGAIDLGRFLGRR